jgi:preprotein translocase subunit SecE
MAKSLKDRMMERLPGTRTASEAETRRKAGEDRGLVEKISDFLQEFKTEMKKVTWPSRKETGGTTAVVIVVVMVIVVFLGVVDFALGKIVQSFLN